MADVAPRFPALFDGSQLFSPGQKRGVWEKLLQRLVSRSRVVQGRQPEPTFSLIDSQSVKTTGNAVKRGIDGGKKSQRA